ncbi:MAG TPA: CDP-alcohol phosphatidyltransferase [Rhodospirillaceae bacterium]|nr:CDP-alcohol phosphatidyltransferase [Rhodospirillaceae bacterium]
MLDSYIRPMIDPPLNAAAVRLARTGVTANTLTAIGLGFSLCAFAALAFQAYGLAILFVVISRLMDGLDGPLARQSQATDLGGYFDIVSDFIFYSGVVFFFAVGRPEGALSAAFLVFSFMGTASSFLAYAIIAAKRGINHEKQGRKSFFYLKGITEGTETISLLIFICVFPDMFAWAAYIFGGLCWLTTLGRTVQAVKDFKPV